MSLRFISNRDPLDILCYLKATGAHEVEVHLGLKGQSSSRRSNSNRSKSKNAATLLLRLWPPSTVQRPQSEDAHGGSPSVVGSCK